jgi:hypothetical protein
MNAIARAADPELVIDLSVVAYALAASTGTNIEAYCHRQHLMNLETSALGCAT